MSIASTLAKIATSVQTLSNKTLTAPVLGTPTSGSLTNCTGINYDGYKNRIINGAMMIDQRNAGASVTATSTDSFALTLDRFAYRASAASKYTVRQNAGSVTPPTGFTKYLGVTSSSAYSVSASDFFAITQQIEGLNIADFAWGTANATTITLSFKVYSSLTGTFGGSIANYGFARSYPFSYSISSANTWTSISITIPGDTSGTWLTTTAAGLLVNFGLGVGSTNSGTAGAWAGVQYISATGATSVVGTNSATFYITGVQLEKGSTATSFDYRPYGTELSLCQRYYEKTFNQSVAPVQNSGSYPGTICAATTGTASLYNLATSWQFKVVKRTTPTITSFSVGAATSDWYAPAGPATVTFTAGVSGDASVYIAANAAPTSFPNIYYVHMTAAAEL